MGPRLPRHHGSGRGDERRRPGTTCVVGPAGSDRPRFRAMARVRARALDRARPPHRGLAGAVGNQRYRTMDNTPGHYQDNRAEYFLAHPDLLAAAGIAAVLFGPGIEDATWYTDARKDGITNPDPTNAFGCDGCNADVAVYPDDDGGFLRLAVGTYYHAGGGALPRR